MARARARNPDVEDARRRRRGSPLACVLSRALRVPSVQHARCDAIFYMVLYSKKVPPRTHCTYQAPMSAAPVAAMIVPIDKSDVHRICSGQVCVDLPTVVKELVENALDAGATTIEVRLAHHGAGSIEVVDNGAGVTKANYQALTRKYHTSKLSNFADLEQVSSFGFRGEALSSICELATRFEVKEGSAVQEQTRRKALHAHF